MINARLDGNEEEIPRYFYKYRPFDEHAFDMLENDYIFLCKAANLDDPSECKATVSLADYYDVKTGRITRRVIDSILSYLHPYTTDESFEQVQNLVYQTITPDGYVRRNYLMDVFPAMQQLAPGADIAQIINLLGNIPERMDEPEMGQKIEHLLFLAYDARQEMGICSLTELEDSTEMWEKYADKSTGYCVQYAVDGYVHKPEIFPVVYSDERDTDILTSIIASFLGIFICGMTNELIQADKSQFIRLFLTKNTVWQYQKEWRIIGNADERIAAPKIEAIILGKNVSKENEERIRQYCAQRNITLKKN